MELERPKRPLSAYNLFYRYKRAKILEAVSEGGDNPEEIVERMASAVAGLEDDRRPPVGCAPVGCAPDDRRRAAIRSSLAGDLFPRDAGGRAHRKSHERMPSFLEMNRIMSGSWGAADGFAKSVFAELAEEGRRTYYARLAEFKEKYPNHREKEGKGKVKPKAKPKAKRGGSNAKRKKAVGGDSAASRGGPSKDVPRSSPVAEIDGGRPGSTGAATPAPAGPGRPKRPLSAYNLFYRFKRSKVLEARDDGDDSEEATRRLITAAPGLEGRAGPAGGPPGDARELRRAEIRSALRGDLSPRDAGGRPHRKSRGGTLSFLEMSDVMSASWKSIDGFTRSLFEELAEEGRGAYYRRLAEYNEKFPGPPGKRAKLQHSIARPEGKRYEKHNAVDDASSSAKDAVLVPPNATRESLPLPIVVSPPLPTTVSPPLPTTVTPPLPTAVSPLKPSSMDLFFSSDPETEQEGRLEMELEPLPLFSGLFDLDELGEEGHVPIGCFSDAASSVDAQPLSEFASDDFHNLPFCDVDASSDDFLTLFEILD